MNRFLAPIVLLTLLFPSIAIGETMDDLVEREGLYYKEFTEVPFTGKVTGQYQGEIKDGKKVGPWVVYRTDGTVNEEYTGTYKNDVKVD